MHRQSVDSGESRGVRVEGECMARKRESGRREKSSTLFTRVIFSNAQQDFTNLCYGATEQKRLMMCLGIMITVASRSSVGIVSESTSKNIRAARIGTACAVNDVDEVLCPSKVVI